MRTRRLVYLGAAAIHRVLVNVTESFHASTGVAEAALWSRYGGTWRAAPLVPLYVASLHAMIATAETQPFDLDKTLRGRVAYVLRESLT